MLRTLTLITLFTISTLSSLAAQSAVTVMQPTAGNNVSGMVHFTPSENGVTITAAIDGLTPGAQHAIHVHQFGDARADNGTSAGGHYNPEGHDHALPHHHERHAGDLGNLQADENGHAEFELQVTNLSIDGELNPVIGRSIIIHAKADDGGQPTGNAGPRIAIGVIGYANPDVK